MLDIDRGPRANAAGALIPSPSALQVKFHLKQGRGLSAMQGRPLLQCARVCCWGRGASRRRKSIMEASSGHTGVLVPRLCPTFPAQGNASSKEANLLAAVAEAAAAAVAAVQAVSSFWLQELGFHIASSC